MTLSPKLIYDDCASAGCTFFVKYDQEYCPNCGTKQESFVPELRYVEPTPSPNIGEYQPIEETIKKNSEGTFKGCLPLLGGFLGIGLTLFSLLGWLLWIFGYSPSYFVLLLIIVGPVIFFYCANKLPGKTKEEDTKVIPQEPVTTFLPVRPHVKRICLDESMFKMEERLQEIAVKRLKISSLIDKFELQNKEREQKIEAKLEKAGQILAEQSSRYQIKIKEIDFLRWQNQLAPIIANIRSQTYEGAESDLKRLSELAESGRKDFGNLTRWIDTLEYSAAGKNMLQRFRETLDSCVKLRDALLEHQAMLVIKDVTPLGEDDKLFFTIPPELVRNVEAFNAEASIKDFSVSVDELDKEFERLEIEDNLSKETRLMLEQSEHL